MMTSLTQVKQFPIKTRSLPSHIKAAYEKRMLSGINEQYHKHKSKVLRIAKVDISESTNSLTTKNVKSFNKITEKMKETISNYKS